MGTIAYTVPQAGTDLNSIADPEIATALTTIKTLVNGNIDTNNLAAAAGITFAQLAAGAGRMSLVAKTATYAANSGELVIAGVTGAPFTVTLPAPSLNALVGVVAGASATGANPITVARHSADVINGVGLASATSLLLGTPGAAVLLQSDGTNWFVIAGQQDTGWVALTLAGSVTAGSGYTPSSRLVGDRVWLKGQPVNGTGSNQAGGFQFATVPTGARPAQTVNLLAAFSNITSPSTNTPYLVAIANSGAVTYSAGFGSWSNGAYVVLDGLSYSLA